MVRGLIKALLPGNSGVLSSQRVLTPRKTEMSTQRNSTACDAWASSADAVLDRFKGLKSNPKVVQKFYDPILRASKISD